MATSVGNLFVNLVARTGRFNQDMKRAGSTVQQFGSRVRSIAKSLTGMMGMLAGGALTGGVVMIVKRQMEAIDTTTKLARQLGVGTEELIKLRHAAELTGSSAGQLDAGLATMAKRLGEAARGSGAAVPALRDLGLTTEDLLRLNPAQQFHRIAVALESIENPSKRNAIAANLFSKANQRLLLTLASGSKGLREYARDAQRLGMVFSEREAAKVEAARDQIYRLREALKSKVMRVVIELSPLIEDFTGSLVDGLATANAEMSKFSKTLYDLRDLWHRQKQWRVGLYQPSGWAAEAAGRGIKGAAGMVGMDLTGNRVVEFLQAYGQELQWQWKELKKLPSEKAAERFKQEMDRLSQAAANAADRMDESAEGAGKFAPGVLASQQAQEREFATRRGQALDFLGGLETKLADWGKDEWRLQREQAARLASGLEPTLSGREYLRALEVTRQLQERSNRQAAIESAEQMRASMMTPVERFKAELQRSITLFGLAGVDPDKEMVARALGRYRSQMRGLIEEPQRRRMPFGGGGIQGTAQWYRSVMQARYGGRDEIDENKKHTKYLDNIDRNIEEIARWQGMKVTDIPKA